MSDTPVAPQQRSTSVPSGIVDDLKSFTAQHDGATATIEHVGRRGARIVLVGDDGAAGDQLAPATDVARAACREAGVRIENGFARELAEDNLFGPGLAS
ncbi:MAG: hypothetical protein WCA46_06420 [Actinocatenispora sp.]